MAFFLFLSKDTTFFRPVATEIFMRIPKLFQIVTAIFCLLCAHVFPVQASNVTWTSSQPHTSQWHAPLFLGQIGRTSSGPSWTGFSYPHQNVPARHLYSQTQQPDGREHGLRDPNHIIAILGVHESPAGTSTPIPMAAWLLGAGIFGLIGFTRKP